MMNNPANTLSGSLQDVLHFLRNSTPAVRYAFDRAASSDIRTGYIDGRPKERLVITLRSPGCAWVTRGGGCSMCGHYAGTTRGEMPSAVEFLAQFRSEIAGYDLSRISILSLYNSGSVLNPGELPSEALQNILREIRNFPSVRKVILESRAEFVDDDMIGGLRDALGPGKSLSIAIGLETADDIKRNLCINKGCTRDEIVSAIERAKPLAEIQIYILLGIPFLTEAEAVEDSISSIRCAHEMGADEIHIEPLTLQRYTLTELLCRQGLYRLPSLYSLYEVLRAVVPEIKPYVSPFLHMPLPESIPQGCPRCNGRLFDGLLKRYNIHRDRESLDYDSCECIETWKERMAEKDPRPLVERVHEAIARLTSEGIL
jgi:archaeosine synthase beta-subunit